jgi:hypothetical protein
VTTITEVTFKDNNLVLSPPITSHPFMYIEWLIIMNNSSMIIFDIENFDGTTPAELTIPQSKSQLKKSMNSFIEIFR